LNGIFKIIIINFVCDPSDLDSEVEMGTRSLDDILDQKGKGQMLEHVPRSSSSSSSFSSVTVVDSNGVRTLFHFLYG